MSTPEKVGGTKHRASPPIQKVGGHVPLSTHGSTPMGLPVLCIAYYSLITSQDSARKPIANIFQRPETIIIIIILLCG